MTPDSREKNPIDLSPRPAAQTRSKHCYLSLLLATTALTSAHTLLNKRIANHFGPELYCPVHTRLNHCSTPINSGSTLERGIVSFYVIGTAIHLINWEVST